MEAPIQELVYAKITDKVPGKASVSIKFDHASGKGADHCVSSDKMKMANCYNQLEIGCRYIIITENTGPKRWVWRKAVLVTTKEMEGFRKIAGLTPNQEEMKAAVKWLKDLRDPPLPPSLADLVTF